MKSDKTAVAEQLSLFGLRPTARMRQQPAGQIALEVLEITEPPKHLMNQAKDARK